MTGFSEQWRGRRVLVTGHTGFKGAWLAMLLDHLGAEVTGFALPPDVEGGVFERLGVASRIDSRFGDLLDGASLQAAVDAAQAEVVIHLAAQAFVPRSLDEPVRTFEVNVGGTARVLEAAFGVPSTRAVVVVTSDKVYENDGGGRAFVESDRLGGHDPYSASKAATELVVASWRHSFEREGSPAVVSARAGNVIGGGDRAPTRLLPDVFRAIELGQPVLLRDPSGVRPWQHVLEPLVGYLAYAAAVLSDAPLPGSLNFGPELDSCRPVREVVERVLDLVGRGSWALAPQAMAGKEAGVLRLDASLAGAALGWRPVLDLDTALHWTVDWFRCEWDGGDLVALCTEQIEQYLELSGARVASRG